MSSVDLLSACARELDADLRRTEPEELLGFIQRFVEAALQAGITVRGWQWLVAAIDPVLGETLRAASRVATPDPIAALYLQLRSDVAAGDYAIYRIHLKKLRRLQAEEAATLRRQFQSRRPLDPLLLDRDLENARRLLADAAPPPSSDPAGD